MTLCCSHAFPAGRNFIVSSNSSVQLGQASTWSSPLWPGACEQPLHAELVTARHLPLWSHPPPVPLMLLFLGGEGGLPTVLQATHKSLLDTLSQLG